MSRAFVKEDEREEQPLAPSRAFLPEGAVNYVTPRGLELLRKEKQELEEELSKEETEPKLNVVRTRLSDLAFRLATARVIDLSEHPPKEIRFGATVRVRTVEGEEREVTLVGADESDAAQKRISLYSPMAQALIGKRAGQRAQVETEEGELLLEILSVRYEHETSEP